jgi:hypothetical protein
MTSHTGGAVAASAAEVTTVKAVAHAKVLATVSKFRTVVRRAAVVVAVATNVPGMTCHSDRGLCIQWNEAHHTWANIPRRCKKLFKSAFALYNDSGETLVITKKE